MRGSVATGLVAVTLCLPATAGAADPILPLSQVQPGMSCTALSVVRGTAPSEFGVDVVDVIRGDPVASGARILIRVYGPALAGNGVGPGFSGSPIYCTGSDGIARNIGAISETLGAFGNDLILATPIEQVLGERPDAPAGARSAPALRSAARPLAGALTVSGLGTQMRQTLARAAKRAGRIAIAAPPGPLGQIPPVDLVPGASVSAGTSTGDIGVGSIGTVTYRDRDALWAFGHPLDGSGRRALTLQDAYVFAVPGNPLGTEEAITYKLAVPLRARGRFTNDGLNAIVGRVGTPPRTIPLTTRVRDLDTGRLVSLRSDVTDERDLELGSALDLTSSITLGQAASQVLRSTPPRLSGRMCVRIAIRERPGRMGFCGNYFDGQSPFDDLSRALGLVDVFKFGRLTPTAVDVGLELRRGLKEVFIVRATPSRRRVRPGQRIRIRLGLRRRRGGTERLSFAYRVPRSARAGSRTLTLRGVVPASLAESAEDTIEIILDDGSGEVGATDPSGDDPGPRSIAELAATIGALRRQDGLRATLSSAERGPVVLPLTKTLIRGKVEIPLRVVRPKRRK